MRYHLVVTGLVQGVGFRPFIEREARKLGLTGSVYNSGGAVHIVVRADLSVLEPWIERIKNHAPRGAVVMDIAIRREEDTEEEKTAAASQEWRAEERESGVQEKQETDGFVIGRSRQQDGGYPILPPDVAVCTDCIREMKDSGDRRYGYPFISCVACGPRYSILKKIPYDRETTSMERFAMCPDCRREYGGDGRRRHAQTISCHVCGPQLIYWEGEEKKEREEAMEAIIRRIRLGGIVAAKGIGGYQYICRPDRRETVLRLRRIKGREEKPFAVMFPDQKMVEAYCICGEEETKLLHSPAAPIVLLEKREEGDIFLDEVDRGSSFVGAFLPTTPFHVRLTEACGPLIVTSANRSGEPILWREEGMWRQELSEADGIASHGREILGPLDDSVTAVVGQRVQMIRRSRGYVPLPVFDHGPDAPEIFAAGGDLKACFALAGGDRIYPSAYFGDMESRQVQDNYCREKKRMEELLSMHPKVYVCDRHPAYFSSTLARKWRQEEPGVEWMEVQHHHAHAASVMAEHRLTHGIGVSFDGTGYGDDGSIWGGEFLFCNQDTFVRMGALLPVPLSGGDASAKQAWQTAVCYLEEAGISGEEWMTALDFGAGRGVDGRMTDRMKKVQEIRLLLAARRSHIQTVRSSSMGRLFDAAAAIAGVGMENGYEGACAIALEQAAREAQKKGEAPYPFTMPLIQEEERIWVEPLGMIRDCFAAVRDRRATRQALALGFHMAVAKAVLECLRWIRRQTGEDRVLLSGGVFANRILLETCIRWLRRDGFMVYWNEQVPCNDGGLAVGQAYLAKLRYGCKKKET